MSSSSYAALLSREQLPVLTAAGPGVAVGVAVGVTAGVVSALLAHRFLRPKKHLVAHLQSANEVPVFVISLRRHTKRRERLAAQAKELRFVDAVDGSRLDRAMPGLTRGEQGCFYSHVGLWLRLSNGTDSVALILEDDANIHLPRQWPGVLAAARAAPPDWDVLYLGHNNQRGKPGIRKAVGDVWGTHALLLTKRGADKLLDAFAQTMTRDERLLPVDVWMSRVAGLRRYCVLPAMVQPFDLSDSETQRIV